MAAQIERSAFRIIVPVFENFSKQVAGTEVPFKTVVVGLLVFGMQQFFSNIVFICPEKYYVTYGVLFIVGPFVVLFCISMQVSEDFWALTTGCCRVPCRRQRVIWVRAGSSLFLATLPPLFWIVFAFADMDFYACAKLGSKDTLMANKTEAEKVEITKLYNQTKSDSQIIAWALFIGFTVFFTLVVTVRRFWKINGELRRKEDFEKFEADAAVSYFNDKLKPLAQQGAKQLVDNLFEKYKDRDLLTCVHLCEIELEDLYPNHSGVVAGKYRKSEVRAGTKVSSAEPSDENETIPLQPMA